MDCCACLPGEKGDKGDRGLTGVQGIPGPSIVSTVSGNILSLGVDGYLFLNEENLCDIGVVTSFNPTTSIIHTVDGCLLTSDILVSPNNGNMLSVLANGVFATAGSLLVSDNVTAFSVDPNETFRDVTECGLQVVITKVGNVVTRTSTVKFDNVTIKCDNGTGELYAEAISIETDATLTGTGLVGDPLSVVPVAVQHDATLGGTGLAGSPLTVAAVPVQHDATMTGTGLVGSPLSVVPSYTPPITQTYLPIAKQQGAVVASNGSYLVDYIVENGWVTVQGLIVFTASGTYVSGNNLVIFTLPVPPATPQYILGVWHGYLLGVQIVGGYIVLDDPNDSAMLVADSATSFTAGPFAIASGDYVSFSFRYKV